MTTYIAINGLADFDPPDLSVTLKLEYRHAMLFIFIVQLSDLFWSMHVLFGILDYLLNCLKILSVYRNVA